MRSLNREEIFKIIEPAIFMLKLAIVEQIRTIEREIEKKDWDVIELECKWGLPEYHAICDYLKKRYNYDIECGNLPEGHYGMVIKKS